jgi:PKHD-type hydroxylase
MNFFLLRSNLVAQPTGVQGLLTSQECAAIISSGESNLELKAGKTEDHRVRENLRRSEIGWLAPNGEYAWLFDRVRDCVNDINAQWFGFHLLGFEGLQFTKYSSGPNEEHDFYSSHRDTALLPGGTIRKLSFTIQLSDPQSYSGGEVILYNSLTDSTPITTTLGSVSFFPSYTIHEVKPVTRGIRYSLVGWACGPSFV